MHRQSVSTRFTAMLILVIGYSDTWSPSNRPTSFRQSRLPRWNGFPRLVICCLSGTTTMVSLQNTRASGRLFTLASSVMVSLPVIVVFFFLQRFFVAGLTAGAVKG